MGERYGCEAADVTGLLPGVSIPAEQPAGVRGVTIATVDRFIDQVAAKVALRLDKAEALSQARKDAVWASARAVVADGAASYTQAARFPVQAGANTDEYAAVLWARYQAGLKQLADTVSGWVADETAGDDDPARGAAGAFPCPVLTEDLRF